MTRKDIIRMAMDIDGHMNDYPGGIDLSWDVLVKIVNKAVAAEREECAKVCENLPKKFRTELCPSEIHDCAAAIRARGEK